MSLLQTISCPNCASDLCDGTVACPYCGASLAQAQKNPSGPTPSAIRSNAPAPALTSPYQTATPSIAQPKNPFLPVALVGVAIFAFVLGSVITSRREAGQVPAYRSIQAKVDIGMPMSSVLAKLGQPSSARSLRVDADYQKKTEDRWFYPGGVELDFEDGLLQKIVH